MTTISTDDFNRANGDPGPDWDNTAGNELQINSNALRSTVTYTGTCQRVTEAGVDDIAIEVPFLGTAGQLELYARSNVGRSQWYRLHIDSTHTTLFRDGTILGQTPGGVVANDVVRLEIEGTTIRAIVNGLTRVTQTDATYSGGATHRFYGVRLQSNPTLANGIDSFLAEDFAGGGPVPTAGTVGVALTLTATARKIAASAATLDLDLSTTDDNAKTGVTAGTLGVEVAATAVALAQRVAAAVLDVDLAVAGDAAKQAETAAVVGLAVDISASSTKAGQVAASLGIDLALAGSAEGNVDGTVSGDLAFALAITATAVKHVAAAGDLDIALDLTGTSQDGTTSATAALGLLLGITGTATKTTGAVSALTLVLALTAQAQELGIGPTISGLPALRPLTPAAGIRSHTTAAQLVNHSTTPSLGSTT